MKKSIYLLFLLLLSQYTNFTFAQSPTGNDFSHLNWLDGTWQRTDAKPGYEAFETWSLIAENVYQGIGVTLKGSDTVFVEHLKLMIKDNQIYYVATVSEEAGPVNFKIIAVNDDGFVASNPAHDFPKEIKYQLLNNKIRATISGNGKSIDFNFERKK